VAPQRPRFARRPPGAALAPYVECYWALTAEHAPPWKSRILPDGSNDIILDLSAAPRSFVVGVMRRADVIPLAGHVDLLGVRFRPGGALPFLRQPLHELADRHVALDALWGSRAGSLIDAVATAPLGDRVAALERLLIAHRAPAMTDDDLIHRAVLLMRRTRGGIGVGAAAHALGVGERRLERVFDIAIGLSPKRFARVVRFLGAVREIGRRALRAGAPVAFELGYSDQPHFVREFKRLAGVTPSQYAAERRVGIVQDEDRLPD
jgi:AraC-like DNA-binding protein